jgi:hypothetical protein
MLNSAKHETTCQSSRQYLMSTDKQKKSARGRPPTGTTPMIGLRLSEDETARVDAWGLQRGFTKLNGEVNRSDTVRAMIKEVLEREPPPRRGKER